MGLTKKDFIKEMEYIDGITIINTSGTILFSVKFNPAFESDKKIIINENLLDIFTNLDPETSTLLKAIKLGVPVYKRKQQVVALSKNKIVTTNITLPIKVRGRIAGAIELSKDITNCKQVPGDNIEISLGNFSESNHVQQYWCSDKARFTLEDIISDDKAIKDLKEYVKKISRSNSPVIIYGETGTGKELFAHAVHNASNRANGPFITQNCAAIPESLLESILFGTTKGSFTGSADNPGLFEAAEGGTLFLDEINSMPINLQSKLLRVLQDGFVRRLGGKTEHPTNVRVVTTTNKNPLECVMNGQLRQDIYYRISVLAINIPPLRERRRDVGILLNYFISRYNKSLNITVKKVSKEVYEFLMKYEWPGNIREFEHFIEYAMNNIDELEDTINIEHVEERIKEMSILKEKNGMVEIVPLKERIAVVEKDLIGKAISKTGGNVSRAAKLLEIPRQTLQQKIEKYQIFCE